MKNYYPVCNDCRKCFAKRNGKCTVLETTYDKGINCPFNKPEREMTNGKRYGYLKPLK